MPHRSLLLVGVAVVVTATLALPLLLTKSLWLDEAWVANDILRPTLDPASLNTTPIGFALLVAVVTHVLPATDAIFRLVPLLLGLDSVFLIYPLALRLDRSRQTALTATFLLAVNLVFIIYCRTLKPYTADAFCAVLILLLSARLEERPSHRRWAAYGVTSMFAPLLSFGSLFVIPVAAAFLLPRPARQSHQWRRVWLIVHAAVFAGVTVYWGVFLRRQRSSGLVDFWRAGFPPSRAPFDVIGWYGRETLAITQYLFSPLSAWLAAPLQIALCLGLIAAVRRRNGRLLLAGAGPLLLAGVAGIAGLYPYGGIPGGGRILLFALPGLLILAASGIQETASMVSGRHASILTGLFLLLAFSPTIKAVNYSLTLARAPIPGDPSEETRQLITGVLLPDLAPGDAIFVSYGAGEAFQRYATRFRQPRRLTPPLFFTKKDGVVIAIGAYPWDLSRVAALHPHRIWLLLAHIMASTEAALLREAPHLGRIELARREPGAVLFRLGVR